MWFIVDDQMADDRRIRRLPLATVGLWVKLCVIHSKGVSMQAKDPAAYPGYFDKLDLKDAGGTMKQLQQLIDMGLMEEHGGGWRPVYAEGICKEPKTLTEEQREARRKAGSKGGRRKAANQKAKQPSSNLLANSQANGEQNSSETGSETSSNLLEDSQAKTWHKTDTYTDIPSPTPPVGEPKQPATPESGFDHFAEAIPDPSVRKAARPKSKPEPVRGHRRKPRRTHPPPNRAPPLQARRQRRPDPQRPHPTAQHMAPRPVGDMGSRTSHANTTSQAHLELRTRPPAHGSA